MLRVSAAEHARDQLHKIAAGRLGEADRGGRTPDYRKLIRVEAHGEYGATLTWAEPKAPKQSGTADKA